jgi:glycosyltransferase involved in cell wall biosynthesis
MPEITLSYVLTTFNKLSFLRVIMPKLIQNRKADEEIIIIDGCSTDGTHEYLEEFIRLKEIDKYISEEDRGEAHGFNKGFLLAKGDLIKVITDDDAYDFIVIQRCKEFMLLHQEIDVIGGNTGSISLENKNSLSWHQDFQDDFFRWKEGKLDNFFFNGTCLMIRRSSLSLTGLFNTTCLLTDLEYTLRVSSIVTLAWCSGIISVRILNPQSNNLVYKKRADEESKKVTSYYNYKYPWIRTKEELRQRTLLRKARSFASQQKIKFLNRKRETHSLENVPFSDFDEAHLFCIKWLKNHPQNQNIQFYSK